METQSNRLDILRKIAKALPAEARDLIHELWWAIEEQVWIERKKTPYTRSYSASKVDIDGGPELNYSKRQRSH